MNADVGVAGVMRRQAVHWHLAARRLADLETVASPEAWSTLERSLGVGLRTALQHSIQRLVRVTGDAVAAAAQEDAAEASVQAARQAYLRTETMLDFFADAIASRSTPRMSVLLGALDTLAEHSMREILDPLGQTVPPVLTFVDKGLGAAILKAGLRLWDRHTDNPVAAIKVVRHNVLRPTSVLHESGHQIAHMLGWNDQLRRALARHLPFPIADVWSSWASEIAADAFAFASAGHAAVTALHDVVDGGARVVYRFLPGDPHPISHLRVLLGVEMCRQSFGPGPWDRLAEAWLQRYPVAAAPSDLQPLLRDSLPELAKVVDVTLGHGYPAFGGTSLQRRLDPARVSPRALARLRLAAGSALESSSPWLLGEVVRLVALSGHEFAVKQRDREQIMEEQLKWMMRIGAMRNAA